MTGWNANVISTSAKRLRGEIFPRIFNRAKGFEGIGERFLTSFEMTSWNANVISTSAKRLQGEIFPRIFNRAKGFEGIGERFLTSFEMTTMREVLQF
jgi:hypothetical protein